MPFSPERALRYAESMARPRRVGSAEEQSVAGQVADALERFGYRVERLPFDFSTAFNVFLTLEISAGLLLILTLLVLQGAALFVAAALLIALLALVGPLNRRARVGSLAPAAAEAPSRWSALCLRMGRRYHTANLVATPRAARPNAQRPHLLLVAHYDSKSQRLPLIARIALFAVFIAAGLACAGLSVLRAERPEWAPAAAAVGVIAVAAGAPLLLLGTGDASPGAIDNASGVGLVLHLAEWLAGRPDLTGDLNVTLLMPGAEEMALMGSTCYSVRHRSALRQQAESGGLHVLNFDGIGVDGQLYLVGGGGRGGGSHRLAGLVREACAAAALPLGRLSVPGALFDHIPFAECGCDAVSLVAIGPASWAVHTRRDTIERLHVRGFERAGRVAMAVIEHLAHTPSVDADPHAAKR